MEPYLALIVAAFLLVIAGLLLWRWLLRWLKQPVRHRVEARGLKRYLEALLLRGYTGGLMIVDAPGTAAGTRRFIQFAKYIGDDGSGGLQFSFPLAPWSESYYARIKEELHRNRIQYATEETEGGPTVEFILVDLQQDLSQADLLARIVLVNVFGLSLDDCVELYYQGVSPRDEAIGVDRAAIS
jgi:hypothetical protein